MPTSPPRACVICGRLSCSGHAPERQAWQPSHNVKRMRGRKLQRERKRLFDEQPLCVLCLAQGITREAVIRDHTLALAFGGLDVPENTQGLCQECSDRKTAEEAKRGRGL